MIKAIKFVSLAVRNQDVSLEFFTQKLGFNVATDQPFNEKQRWIELKIPGADTRLVLFTAEGHENRIGSFSGISFVSDDVVMTYKSLCKQGVQFQSEPKVADWGTSVIMLDPDGNQFVISSK